VTGVYVGVMGDTGDIDRRLAEQSERIARMEERMDTLRSDLSATLSGFRADMAGMMKEIAKDNATMTERMATARWWQTAILAAALGISVAALGVLSNLPGLVALIAN